MNSEQQNEIFRHCRPKQADVLMMNKRTIDKPENEGYVVRSERNTWAEDYEETLRSLSPFPISYDIGAIQSTGFSEFAYTEFPSGGLWIMTQSKDVNARIIHNASSYEGGVLGDQLYEKFVERISDKYDMDMEEEDDTQYDHVVFLPGHNLLDLVDQEILQRLLQEEDDVIVKPHPLTDYEFLRMVSSKCGWNKVLHREYSGTKLLHRCKTVYTTTASEFSITGAALGKRVYNISKFTYEGAGVYHPFMRLMSVTQKREGKEAAIQKLKNILACPWSGIIFDFQDDYEERTKKFFEYGLEMRELYRPICMGRGDIDKHRKK